MDAKALVEKYIIIKVEQNGRVGVKPTNGKPTAREIEYLKTHKDEVFAAIEARETEYARWQAVVNAEAALKVEALDAYRRDVAPLEDKYLAVRDNPDSVTTEIAARNEYLAALNVWRAQYPNAELPGTIRWNDCKEINPWTL